MEPIRVLCVIPGEAEGVSMIFAKNQVISLQRAGVITRTFFLASRTSLSVLINELQRFRREILLFKPDIVHAHYGTMTVFFCIIATRIPMVVTFRGNDLILHPSISRLRSAIGILFSQIAALRAKRIICVSDDLKDLLWWRRSRTDVIPSGIDTTVFYPFPRDKARSKLGWGKEERVVLFNIGRDPIRKRLDLAQSAIDVAMAICGEIRFVVLDGYVNQKGIPTIMNASDCLLCTSDSEGSPNIVKEAIACNLPIVSVDVGDVRKRLEKVRPSKIVKRDREEIGKAIAEILMRSDRSNGFETIQELSLDRIATRILSVYKTVLRETRNEFGVS